MKKISITIALQLITFLSLAQNENPIVRKGFIFGTSLGVANTFQSFPNKSQTDLDFALDLKFGYLIHPNFALLLTTNVSGYDYSGIGRDRKRDFGILAPSVQYWFHERFYVLGGVGLGMDAPVFFDIKDPDNNPEETAYYAGFGMVGAVGYEIYQTQKLAFDLKFRVTYRNVNLPEGRTTGISPALLFGITFY